MRLKILKISAITIFAAIGIVACRKYSSHEATPIGEYKEWLKINGGIFAEGRISIDGGADGTISGKLNWASATSISTGSAQTIVIPFIFDNSISKTKKIYKTATGEELPSMYHLIIRKDAKGGITGALRIGAFKEGVIVEDREIQRSFYDLNGKHLSSSVTKSNGKHIVLNEVENGSTSASRCDVSSTTIRWVDCYGGMDNTLCVFRVRTTYTYHCELEPGVDPPGEWETPQPEDPGGGGGWYEYDVEVEEYENQRVIDSLQGYPCAQDILKALPNLNNTANAILQGTFGVNDYTNIIFKPDPSLPEQENAKRTDVSYDNGVFSATIVVNPNMLQNSSKEFIAGVFFHEAIHAFMDYQIGRLRVHEIDTATFKQQFPLIWKYKNTGESSHEQIVETYLNDIKGLLFNFNPNMSFDMINAIAWKGLQLTDDWRALGNDTVNLRNLQSVAKSGNLSQMQAANLKKCN